MTPSCEVDQHIYGNEGVGLTNEQKARMYLKNKNGHHLCCYKRHRKVGIHKWIIAACYDSLNGNN